MSLLPSYRKKVVDSKVTLDFECILSVPNVEAKMTEDGMDSFLLAKTTPRPAASDNQKIVYYLYGLGFAAEDLKEQRIQRIRKFLEAGAKERMIYIIKTESEHGQLAGDGSPLSEIWDRCQLDVLLYEELEGATTILAGKAFPLVGRMQKSKNCYMHAAAQLPGYKIAYSRTDNNFARPSPSMSRSMFVMCSPTSILKTASCATKVAALFRF